MTDLAMHDAVNSNGIGVVLIEVSEVPSHHAAVTCLILGLSMAENSLSGGCVSRVIPNTDNFAIYAGRGQLGSVN